MLKYLIKKKDTILIILVIISVGLLIFAQLLYPSSFLALFLGSIKSHIGKSQPLDLAKWRATLHGLSALCFISAITLSLWFYWDLIESKLPLPIKRTIRNLTPRIFIVIVLVSSLLSFFSSLVVNFLTHSFADGWWTATAQLLNDKTLLYRDVEIWTTPLRVLIAYYLNQLGPILLWEKLFGLVVLLTIWFGLWRLNLFLTRNLFISLAFTAISVSIGQMFVATIYYDYNLVTVMLVILVFLAESKRLKERETSFASECLWLMVSGLLSGFLIFNKYTDGIANLFFLFIYFFIYFTIDNSGKESKNYFKNYLLFRILAFFAGLFTSLFIVWIFGFFIVDFYEMPRSILEASEGKGGASLIVKLFQGLAFNFYNVTTAPLKSIGNGEIFQVSFLDRVFKAILPFLLVFNVVVMTRSLFNSTGKYNLSQSQRFICLLMSLLALGSFIPTLMSNAGGWDNSRYFYNVIPLSIMGLIFFTNTKKMKVKILKFSSVILAFISIPLSINKTFRPYQWFLSQGKLKFEQLEFSSSAYYAYIPISKRYSRVIDHICSTLSDHKAAVISYPVPFANLACDKKYPLNENIFWYDVANSQKIYTLLNWLRDNSKRPVYVVFFYDPKLLKAHESGFGLKPAHKELESYLLSQKALGNNAQYILKDSIRYQGITVKIYQSISR